MARCPAPPDAAVERHVLDLSRWVPGRQASTGVFAGRHARDVLSLSLEGASPDQRTRALAAAVRWGVAASVVRSRSLGNVDAMRVCGDAGDGIPALKAAAHASTPSAWAANLVDGGGMWVPALNLRLTGYGEGRAERTLRLLRGFGVDAFRAESLSLGGVSVIRVAGEEAIARLRAAVPGLRTPPAAAPDPAAPAPR